MQASSSAVLDALRPAGPMTAAEIMRLTGLSRPTVHAACEELIRLGWAVERDARRTGEQPRTGRPARVYEFDATAGHVLGVDMGVHKVTAVLADLRGSAVTTATVHFRGTRISAAERLDVVRAVVTEVLGTADVTAASVLAVGLAVPAAVDAVTGRTRTSEDYLPGLAAVDLREALVEPFGWSGVHVDNDANLAALAERWRGAIAGEDDAVVLLAGERLGAGLLLGGALRRGRHGGAGEMRFLDLIPGVAATGIGTWARVLGARAQRLHERRNAQRRPDLGSLLRAGALRGSGGDHGLDDSVPTAAEIAGGGPRAQDVFDAARKGERWALDVVGLVADKLATALAPVVTLLDPGVVVLSGAVAASCDVLIPGIEARLGLLAPWPARIVASELGDRVVVTGAVRMALDSVEAALRP
jgi:predicted NBD/HSP70 family sugar kinase